MASPDAPWLPLGTAASWGGTSSVGATAYTFATSDPPPPPAFTDSSATIVAAYRNVVKGEFAGEIATGYGLGRTVTYNPLAITGARMVATFGLVSKLNINSFMGYTPPGLVERSSVPYGKHFDTEVPVGWFDGGTAPDTNTNLYWFTRSITLEAAPLQDDGGGWRHGSRGHRRLTRGTLHGIEDGRRRRKG